MLPLRQRSNDSLQMKSRAARASEIIEDLTNPPQYSAKIVVIFKNRPSRSVARLLLEQSFSLVEGKHQQFGNYRTRLDNRPVNQGGPQLHITGPNGAWAFRATGARSEPHKYTDRTTNKVKDIVTQVFNIPRSQVEHCEILSANPNEMLVEVTFL